VPDRVLDQRLENEARDHCTAHTGLHLERHPQPLAVARLLDLGM
jgi:hypothetical protein